MSLQEDAHIEKSDGQVVGPYKAIFAGSTIIIADANADVESGDTVLRKLPNGKDERSVVTQAKFYRVGIGGLGGHYQIKFREAGESSNQPPTQNINISNAHSFQIGDFNRQTIVSSFDALIKEIDASDTSPKEKEEAKTLLSAFLKHPLVVSVLGSVARAILK